MVAKLYGLVCKNTVLLLLFWVKNFTYVFRNVSWVSTDTLLIVQMEHQMTSNNIEFKASEFRNIFLVYQSLPINID